MAKSRTFNAKRNMFSGIVNKVVVLGLPFAIRTIIIKELGAEFAGLSSLFTSILQVLNMAELGFSSAIAFSLYKPMANNDEDTICSLLKFYRNVYRIVGVVILVAGIALMPFLPYLIKDSYPDTINLYILFLIYLVNTVFSYLAFAYKSVLLSASQRQDIVSNISTVLDAIKCVIQIITLMTWKNYYAYIAWNVVFTIANNLVIAYITKRRFPRIECRGKIEEQRKRSLVKQIKGLAIGQISKTARNSLDTVILSALCGLIDVAMYGNYYYVFSAVLGFFIVIIQSVSAGVGNSIATESVDKNYNDFKRFNYYLSWIGGWCTVCLLCLYQPFMELWAGKELTVPFWIMFLFCAYFYIMQMGQVRSMYANAAGLWWEFRWLEVLEMFANLTLNIYLGWKFGMAGILWATIITVFLFSIVGSTIVTFKHYFKRSCMEYFLDCFIYCIVTLVAGFITYLGCQRIVVEGIGGLGLRLGISVLIPNVIFFLISIISCRHRKYLIELMKK